MSHTERSTPAPAGACSRCLRRSWLLGQLSGPLEFCARDRERLLAVLTLGEEELIDALGGRRRAELKAAYADFQAGEQPRDVGVESICRHDRDYPGTLTGPAAPAMLRVAGGAARMSRLTSAPMVAILGSSRASDYGMEVARGLGRALTASGVTIVSVLSDGVAVAAQAGALDAHGGALAVIGGGLGVAPAVRHRGMLERVRNAGCAVSELPSDCARRRWAGVAGERIPAELAQLSIVVEAEESAGDLFAPRIARSLGRAVAAVPGRVSSALSRGTHALLMEGASLVRDPEDALELLCTGELASAQVSRRAPAGESQVALEPRLRAVLEQVGAGADTQAKLTRGRGDHGETLLALSELELMGLLRRGDGGRYVARWAPSGAASTWR